MLLWGFFTLAKERLGVKKKLATEIKIGPYQL
jgi:hypothetical protein